jgi:serine/threonine protein kinase
MTSGHTGKVGTEMYMSPEMITFKGRGRVQYSFKTDIWGVGMVFAELMCLDYAFDVNSQLERVNAIAHGNKL